ncbi:MAG: glycosyltransferase [Woeseiaceae bacterium]
MKIAHLELGRHLYGGAEQVRYLLQGLQSDEHEHVLLTPPGSALHDWALAEEQPVVPIKFSGEHDLAFIIRLVRWLRRDRVDLLHVHSRRGADWLGPIAGALARVTTIVSRRVDNPPSRPLVWLMRNRYVRVICISDAIRGVLQDCGVDDETLLTIRSAVDVTPFQALDSEGAEARLLGEPAQGPVIAVIAQLIERKGHRYLLMVLGGLLKKFPGLRVVFLGKGPLEETLKDEVIARGLDDCVIFAGFRDDLPDLLPAISLVVHPALTEGLGVSLLQAAAAGIPVVAFAAGGVREAIAHEHSGFLVRTGDEVALAAAIGRLLSDDELRRTFGDNAAKRVARDFSVDTMVQRHSALYDVLAEERL